MTELLLKIFIKNSNDTDNPVVRQKYGMLSGIVGITCNIILFLLKFLAGIITGAVSVAADAFNNLSDAGSSIVTFIGFKVSGKPADTEHPFGHGRIEYISGLIVAAAIIVMGIDVVLLPFTTPETAELLGYQKAKLVGRLLGILLIAVGIWVGFL